MDRHNAGPRAILMSERLKSTAIGRIERSPRSGEPMKWRPDWPQQISVSDFIGRFGAGGGIRTPMGFPDGF